MNAANEIKFDLNVIRINHECANICVFVEEITKYWRNSVDNMVWLETKYINHVENSTRLTTFCWFYFAVYFWKQTLLDNLYLEVKLKISQQWWR